MLLPMTLLFTAFCVLNLRTIDRDLKRQGRQTVDAVDVNFDLVLSNVPVSYTHLDVYKRQIFTV